MASGTASATKLSLSGLKAYLILLYAVSFPLFVIDYFLPHHGGPGRVVGGLMSGEPPSPLFAVAGLVLFAAQIMFLILMFRAWRFVIAELQERNITPSVASPGRAIGFCFIPFFNFCWLFIFFGKLTQDFNKLAEAAGSKRQLAPWFGYSIPVFLFVMFFPAVSGAAFVIGCFVLYPLFIATAISSCTALRAREIPKNVREIASYADILDWKAVSRNVPAALAFLAAQLASTLASAWALYFSGHGVLGVPEQALAGALVHVILIPMLLTVAWYFISGLAREAWMPPLFYGAAAVLLQILFSLVFYHRLFILPTVAYFLSAALFMGGLVLTVQQWGASLKSFLVGSSGPVVISLFYTVLQVASHRSYWSGYLVAGIATAIATGALLYGGISLAMAQSGRVMFDRQVASTM